MNIYDIKLEGDTVTLTFNDQTVKTYKEFVADVPVEEKTEKIEVPVTEEASQ